MPFGLTTSDIPVDYQLVKIVIVTGSSYFTAILNVMIGQKTLLHAF